MFYLIKVISALFESTNMKINEMQKKESQLGVYQTAVILMTPLALTLFVGTEFARLWISGLVGISCAAVIYLQSRRVQYRVEIKRSYENLETGIILRSRFAAASKNRYIITQLTPQYYHVKGIQNDKQFVLSRKKAIESYFVDSESVTTPESSPRRVRSELGIVDSRS